MGQQKQRQLRVVAGALLAGSVYLAARAASGQSWRYTLLSGWTGLCFLTAAAMVWDMSRLSPADSHTATSILLQYLITRLFRLVGWKVRLGLEMASLEVAQTQSELLMSLLRRNKDTEFGRRHSFVGIGTVREYMRQVPLSEYADYEEYVRRTGEGEHGLLTAAKVVYLAQTSGTTGRCKDVPITPDMKGPAAKKFGPLMYYMMHRKCGLTLQRAFVLSYRPRVTASACGLQRGPVSAHMSRYVPFVVSPRECYDVTVEQAALHVHAVFGFREPEVGHAEVLVATLMYSFWRYVELHWERICDDIEAGALSSAQGLDGHLLRRLNARLKPDPSRASQLRREFENGMTGVAKRIWPNLTFVRMLTTGGFAPNAEYLKHVHLKGVAQLSLAHAASEGFFGFNLDDRPDANIYTAMVTYAFMEFIPVQHLDDPNPRTFLADELRERWSYEVVFTTPMGFYRYRTGDVIKVIGHYYETPIYTFEYRLGQILNVYWEKTHEKVMYEAVAGAVESLGKVMLTDYTATEEVNLHGILKSVEETESKCYYLFIEVEHKSRASYNLSDDDKAQFDKALCELSEMYTNVRLSGSLSPMQVVQLKPGTFLELKQKIIGKTQNQQYKLPRAIRNKEILGFLVSHTYGSVDSPNNGVI